MASAYGIVMNHDGTTNDSETGRGTVVKIYLPAIESKENVEEKAVSEPKVKIAEGEGTILVIEDEAPLLKLNRRILDEPWLSGS